MIVCPSACSSARIFITSSPERRVECPRRLVRENDLAAVHERARDTHALLLAARKLPRLVAQAVAHAKPGREICLRALGAVPPA